MKKRSLTGALIVCIFLTCVMTTVAGKKRKNKNNSADPNAKGNNFNLHVENSACGNPGQPPCDKLPQCSCEDQCQNVCKNRFVVLKPCACEMCKTLCDTLGDKLEGLLQKEKRLCWCSECRGICKRKKQKQGAVCKCEECKNGCENVPFPTRPVPTTATPPPPPARHCTCFECKDVCEDLLPPSQMPCNCVNCQQTCNNNPVKSCKKNRNCPFCSCYECGKVCNKGLSSKERHCRCTECSQCNGPSQTTVPTPDTTEDSLSTGLFGGSSPKCHCLCKQGCTCKTAILALTGTAGSAASAMSDVSVALVASENSYNESAATLQVAAQAGAAAERAARAAEEAARYGEAAAKAVTKAMVTHSCTGSQAVIVEATVRACACANISASATALAAAAASAEADAQAESSACARAEAEAVARAEACASAAANAAAKASASASADIINDCEGIRSQVTLNAQAAARAATKASVCIGIMAKTRTRTKVCASAAARALAKADASANAAARAAVAASTCASEVRETLQGCDVLPEGQQGGRRRNRGRARGRN